MDKNKKNTKVKFCLVCGVELEEYEQDTICIDCLEKEVIQEINLDISVNYNRSSAIRYD